MKLLIDGEYAEIHFWSFFKLWLVGYISFFILLALIGFLAGVLFW